MKTGVTRTCAQCGCTVYLRTGDRFCCMCGSEMPFVRMEMESWPQLYADHPVEASLVLKAINEHASSVTITRITSSCPALEANGQPGRKTLAAGESATFQLVYTTAKLPEARFPLEVDIVLEAVSDGVMREDRSKVTILPKPEIEAVPRLILANFDGADTGGIQATVALRCSGIEPDLITGNADHSDSLFLGYAHIDGPKGQLHIGLLPEHMEVGAVQPCRIRVAPEGRPPIPVELEIWLAPIRFDRTSFSVYTGHIDWVPVDFTNVSKRDLTITGARLTSTHTEGGGALDARYALELEEDLPVTLAPNEGAQKGDNLRLKVDADDLGKGEYRLTVELDLELGEGESHTLSRDITLTVDDPPEGEFPGVLSIDFGTSNTCCAYFDPHDDKEPFKILPLDDVGKEEFIPSVLSIRGEGECLIGHDALHGENYLSLLKMKLGSGTTVQGDYEARDLVCLFIRETIWRAEKKLRQRIRHVVFSYPSRFTNRQINDYRYILSRLKKQGVIEQCYMIDEASAGALSAIYQRDGKEPYSLFVFDFGGGTIDMTYSEVVPSSNENDPTLVKVLNMGGEREFGRPQCQLDLHGPHRGRHTCTITLRLPGCCTRTPGFPLPREHFQENPHQLSRGTVEFVRGKPRLLPIA